VNGPQSEKELFERARALPEGERDAFLENECPDPALRERVRRLLAHAEAAGESFLAEVLRGELEQAVPAPSPPERLGDFRILDRIGVGGMGIVYLAEDTTLGRRVALKVLAPHLAHSEHDRARFKHEARIVARLNHPGVVPVYTFGESEGFLYIASELIEGESLQQRLQRMREAESGGPASLDAQDAARIGVAVADALEHAHQAKVIHRDVKPSNILLATDGAPRLTDFGIAKLLNDEAPVTSAGAGTAHYMSPEQAALASVEIDHRTDIFSLGVVLYEALAGRVPFDGATREQVIEALRREEPRPLRALNERVPVDLQTIVMKAIEKFSDHVIICGAGRTGHQVAEELTAMGVVSPMDSGALPRRGRRPADSDPAGGKGRRPPPGRLPRRGGRAPVAPRPRPLRDRGTERAERSLAHPPRCRPTRGGPGRARAGVPRSGSRRGRFLARGCG